MTAQHRGRVAMLLRAAYDLDMGPRERDNLIRLGAPDHDREHVLATLKRIVDLRAEWKGQEADALLKALTEPPTQGDTDG